VQGAAEHQVSLLISALRVVRRIDEIKLPGLRGIFVRLQGAQKGRIAGLCNPLRNTAGGRKDKQAGNFFERN
jgi:hypothetical protein